MPNKIHPPDHRRRTNQLILPQFHHLLEYVRNLLKFPGHFARHQIVLPIMRRLLIQATGREQNAIALLWAKHSDLGVVQVEDVDQAVGVVDHVTDLRDEDFFREFCGFLEVGEGMEGQGGSAGLAVREWGHFDRRRSEGGLGGRQIIIEASLALRGPQVLSILHQALRPSPNDDRKRRKREGNSRHRPLDLAAMLERWFAVLDFVLWLLVWEGAQGDFLTRFREQTDFTFAARQFWIVVELHLKIIGNLLKNIMAVLKNHEKIIANRKYYINIIMANYGKL